MEQVPFSIRDEYASIQKSVFHNLVLAYNNTDLNDHPLRVRGWKLFCLLSRMLLHRLRRGGSAGSKELRKRIDAFREGRW